MKKIIYSTQYAKLTKLILSMSPDQQEQMLEIASRVHQKKISNGNENMNFLNIVFTSGILAGSGFVTICLIIFSIF